MGCFYIGRDREDEQQQASQQDFENAGRDYASLWRSAVLAVSECTLIDVSASDWRTSERFVCMSLVKQR